MKRTITPPTFNKPSQRARVGYCYANAFRFFVANPTWVLVHGICVGTGGNTQGKEFGHAWVEKLTRIKVGKHWVPQWWVYDSKTKEVYIRELYYLTGQVKFTKRYSAKSILKNMELHRTYGPWNQKIFDSYHGGKRIPLNKGVKK